MKTLITVVALLASVLSVSAGELKTRINNQSRYYGVGWQSDGNHWSIEVILEKEGGLIAYPSIGCTGKWNLIGQGDALVRYRETITDGIADCVTRGTVELTPQLDDRLLYTWRETAETIDARAILVPLSGPRLTYMELLKLTLSDVDLAYAWPEFRE